MLTGGEEPASSFKIVIREDAGRLFALLTPAPAGLWFARTIAEHAGNEHAKEHAKTRRAAIPAAGPSRHG
jgi:hypothetical protein